MGGNVQYRQHSTVLYCPLASKQFGRPPYDSLLSPTPTIREGAQISAKKKEAYHPKGNSAGAQPPQCVYHFTQLVLYAAGLKW